MITWLRRRRRPRAQASPFLVALRDICLVALGIAVLRAIGAIFTGA